jgi:LacI family transcriptional regulator
MTGPSTVAGTPSRIQDVASAAGVSTATVSRALASPERVSPATRQRVLEAVQALNFRPNPAASALASGRSNAVGFLLPTLDNTAFSRMAQAMQAVLNVAGYQLLIASHEYDYAAESSLTRTLLRRQVDALVLVGNDRPEDVWTTLQEWKKPVLLTWSSDPRFPSIGINNVETAGKATSHMLSLGHRRIGVIVGHTRYNDRQRARTLGARQVLERAGCGLPHSRLTEQELTFEGGALGLRTLMTAAEPPTAIVCGNDYLAAGALLEAQRMGLKVPSQLSICGFDNMDLASALNPGLTTLHVPSREMGKMAAHNILTLLDGESVAAETLLPAELVVRGSTARVSRSQR